MGRANTLRQYLFQRGWKPIGSGGVALGRGEKIVDAKFVDFAKSDSYLTSGSPAVDAGERTDFATDFDGNPVTAGKAPDIGAYEFRGRNR